MGLNSDKTMATASWGTYRGHDGMRPPKFHQNRSIDRRVIAFPILLFATSCLVNKDVQYSAIWRPSAILNMNFVILDHPRSQLCGSITMSKFGIDPIFPAGDNTVL